MSRRQIRALSASVRRQATNPSSVGPERSPDSGSGAMRPPPVPAGMPTAGSSTQEGNGGRRIPARDGSKHQGLSGLVLPPEPPPAGRREGHPVETVVAPRCTLLCARAPSLCDLAGVVGQLLGMRRSSLARLRWA
ncbi:hypothetical protein ACQJBY_066191 [Aegilops geniculata]